LSQPKYFAPVAHPLSRINDLFIIEDGTAELVLLLLASIEDLSVIRISLKFHGDIFQTGGTKIISLQHQLFLKVTRLKLFMGLWRN